MQFIKNYLTDANLSLFSIQKVTLSDIIDILIVAYFIYKIMIWIKETRAWSLFKGVAIILMISTIAYLLNFYTIIWIVENAFSVGIIAIIILFQPEFRKALEQIGKGKMNLPFSLINTEDETELSEQSLEEIIKACKTMSVVKTGALIVLEKDVALGDHERTGIPIDAVVTSQILINIFEDKTPLHDGAVIVRNNRVAAATCILPLTQSQIGSELGTRHRAAVGTSEVSDAYILVVSEETGNISIARGGKLYKNLSEESIRKMLVHHKQEKKKLILWKGKTKT